MWITRHHESGNPSHGRSVLDYLRSRQEEFSIVSPESSPCQRSAVYPSAAKNRASNRPIGCVWESVASTNGIWRSPDGGGAGGWGLANIRSALGHGPACDPGLPSTARYADGRAFAHCQPGKLFRRPLIITCVASAVTTKPEILATTLIPVDPSNRWIVSAARRIA